MQIRNEHTELSPTKPNECNTSNLREYLSSMNKRSRLHLPRSPARPGERPDFGYVHLSPAGAVPQPDVNARARDIESLAVELVRVLDDAHEAVGPWNPHLD